MNRTCSVYDEIVKTNVIIKDIPENYLSYYEEAEHCIAS